MRALVVHNRYSASTPSGENVSVDSEVAWLRDAGVDVRTHEVTNDDVMSGDTVAMLRTTVETVWSPSAARRFERELDEFRPDVVHVHNLFPLLSASVPQRALRRGVPVVWTARNMRVLCVEGTQFRAGGDCTACRPGWRLPGMRHGCYRGSVAASTLVTGATAIFRRLARSHLTVVAISEALRTWLVDRAGFDAARVHLKYNGIARPPASLDELAAASSTTLLYVGKFAPYKGIDLLLDAWQRVRCPQVRLCFVGDGPLADHVRAATADPRIEWVGRIPAADVAARIARARAVVVPSVWDEPFGRVAAEAMAVARPVVTTGRGGLAEVVGQAGWITGTDPSRLAQAIDEVATSDEEVAARGAAGRARYARLFSPEATTRALLDIYERAIDPTGRSSGRAG